MPLFRKAEPAVEEKPTGGGKDVVRGIVRARTRTPGAVSLLKEELHLSSGMLESFCGGADNLTAEQIGGVLAYFGFNATYAAETDLLCPKSEPAKTLCASYPASHVSARSQAEVFAFFGAPPPQPAAAPRPVKEAPPKEAVARPARPGWAS
jgi:hypothetical protein